MIYTGKRGRPAKQPADHGERVGHDVYRTREWHRMRTRQLRDYPWCRYCLELSTETRGTFVDHIKPHGGNAKLFFDDANLQTLCEMHHNSTKQREEVRGGELGCDIFGMPNDKEHYWYGGSPVHKEFQLQHIQRKRR
jgi:5-methylcytosine-specific restriction enzyme A